MASRGIRRLGILLLTFIMLRLSQSISLLNSPHLSLDTPTNTTSTKYEIIRVPGRSPFKYVGYPDQNLLRISSLTMSPNPCTLRSECELKAQGYFKSDISNPLLNVNISSDYDGRPVPIFLVEDDLCDWVDVKQGGAKSCPPRLGPATLNFKMLLMQGWIPEATYGIDVKVTAGKDGAIVSHIYADLLLRDPIGKP